MRWENAGVKILNEGYIAQLTEVEAGRINYSFLIRPAVLMLQSIQQIQTSFMLLCGKEYEDLTEDLTVVLLADFIALPMQEKRGQS